MPYLLSMDSGTTSCRALLFDEKGGVTAVAQEELTQHYRQPGWVEHDAAEIRDLQLRLAQQVAQNVEPGTIAAIGITNQRETTVVWDRQTGEPIHNAIVWQDRRTTDICARLVADGLEDHIRTTTGLRPDPYFSATKIAWLLENVDGVRERAERGDLAFGNIDTWLLWNLTYGAVHATDVTNASRTMLYDIRRGQWDETMLEALNIPASLLPDVRPSSGLFGETSLFGGSIPIMGIAGDQQAALFGQACFEPGMAKNTYGTGCFMLLNTGSEPILSENGLLTTIAWDLGDGPVYALEGSVFIAGAAIQWLRDEMGLLENAAESEQIAASVESTDGVYVVPAFVGLGAPYWEPNARGAVFGLTRGSTRAHLVRATLESIAYRTRDVLDAMSADADLSLAALRVDGGAALNDFLMQFQADILNVPVERPASVETTAWGAAALAGLAAGLFNLEVLADLREVDAEFEPEMDAETRNELYDGWRQAVETVMTHSSKPENA